MKRLSFGILLAPLMIGLWAGAMEFDWAYHEADGQTLRTTEKVPGLDVTFLENGSEEIRKGERIVLYLCTANQFAGDADEQIFVRWWNGTSEHWIAGEWVTNVMLDVSGEHAGTFRGKPDFGSVLIDVWRIVIPPHIVRLGDNYYVIQLKAWSPYGVIEGYLLRDSGAEGARTNNLGQAYTEQPNYAGHDWLIKIVP